MDRSVKFTFEGQFDCGSFLSFAQHRASRLALQLQPDRCSETAMSMLVSGQEALVDMFEMACSLGPYDCIVLEVKRSDAF